jgi:hypothetical protein
MDTNSAAPAWDRPGINWSTYPDYDSAFVAMLHLHHMTGDFCRIQRNRSFYQIIRFDPGGREVEQT